MPPTIAENKIPPKTPIAVLSPKRPEADPPIVKDPTPKESTPTVPVEPPPTVEDVAKPKTPVEPPPIPVVPMPKPAPAPKPEPPIPVAKDGPPAIKPNPTNPFPTIPDSVPSLRPLAELSHRIGATAVALADGRLIYRARSSINQFDTGRNFTLPNAVSDLEFGLKGMAWTISPDGRTLYLGLPDQKTLYSQVNGGAPIRNFADPGLVSALAISPDGKTLVSGSLDGGVIVWNAATGDRIVAIPKHPQSVRQIVFSRDSTHFATQCAELIQVNNLKLRQTVGSSRHSFGQRVSLEISPDNAKLLVGTAAGLHVAMANKLEFEATRPLPDTFVHIKFADPKTLAALGSDGPSIWEWPSLKPLKKARTSATYDTLAVSSDGRILFAGSEEPRICVHAFAIDERATLRTFMPGMSVPTRMPDLIAKAPPKSKGLLSSIDMAGKWHGRSGNSEMDLDVRKVGTKYAIVIAMAKDGMTGRAHCDNGKLNAAGKLFCTITVDAPMPAPFNKSNDLEFFDLTREHLTLWWRNGVGEGSLSFKFDRVETASKTPDPLTMPGSRKPPGREGGMPRTTKRRRKPRRRSTRRTRPTTPRRRPPIGSLSPRSCCAPESRRRTMRTRATLSSRRPVRLPRRPASGRLRRTRSIGSTSSTRSMPWPCARRHCRCS